MTLLIELTPLELQALIKSLSLAREKAEDGARFSATQAERSACVDEFWFLIALIGKLEHYEIDFPA